VQNEKRNMCYFYAILTPKQELVASESFMALRGIVWVTFRVPAACT
jgi:hypothetical protein